MNTVKSHHSPPINPFLKGTHASINYSEFQQMKHGTNLQKQQYYQAVNVLRLREGFDPNDFTRAIRSFQQSHGIYRDGDLGKKTMDKILHAPSKKLESLPAPVTSPPFDPSSIAPPEASETESTTKPKKDVLEEYSEKQKPYLKALHPTIGDLENYNNAPDEGYKSLVGGRQFESYYDHPRISVPVKIHGKTIYSTCAGRYQIRARNWDFLTKTYRDYFVPDKDGHIWFSPQNQDIAALLLITRVRGLTPKVLQKIINSGNLKQIFRRLRNEWASLPNNNYNQNPKSMEEVLKIYHKYLEIEKAKALQPPDPNV